MGVSGFHKEVDLMVRIRTLNWAVLDIIVHFETHHLSCRGTDFSSGSKRCDKE